MVFVGVNCVGVKGRLFETLRVSDPDRDSEGVTDDDWDSEMLKDCETEVVWLSLDSSDVDALREGLKMDFDGLFVMERSFEEVTLVVDEGVDDKEESAEVFDGVVEVDSVSDDSLLNDGVLRVFVLRCRVKVME